jgi:N utilization substance protein B
MSLREGGRGALQARSARRWANTLVAGTIQRVTEIDELIARHLKNWRIERVAVIDRLVMRLAIFEMLTEADTPPKVVINEALELARTFTTEESVKFINGMLDAIRKKLPVNP